MADTTLDDLIDRMGPLEPHLAALAGEVDLPVLAVGCCIVRLTEAAPILRAVIAKAAEGAALSDDEGRLLLRGIFILGSGRDTGAFPVFLRLLRCPAIALEALLGDVLEVWLPKLISGMFDGDAEALLALPSDATCLNDVRLSALEAAAFLTFDGRITRERMQTFLAGLAKGPATPGDHIWITWADTIARLGLRDLAPLVDLALADGRIPKSVMRRRQFEKELAAAEANPDDPRPFRDASYISDVTEALEWTRTGEEYDTLPGIARDAPIEAHLAALAAPELPDVALTVCVERFEEAAPQLRALLDRAAAGMRLSEVDSLRLFRGLFVLAAARDTASCPSLLRLLHRPAQEIDELLGDAVDVSLGRIVISIFDGDAEALLALIGDPILDGSLRGTVLEAATYLVWERRIDREAMRRVLVAFHEKRPAPDETYVWYAWMMAVAHLDFGDLVPLVETAWKAHRIDHSILEWSDFKIDLARARTAWDDADRFAPSQCGYVDDVAAELEWTRDWDEEDLIDAPEIRPSPPETPVMNPFKNVGRNDPCPCGSGKKYKKCCLASS